MEYGICNLAIVPLRAEPNERSEQVSQILFGEAFEVIEWKDSWVQIITALDNYKGWIGTLQFTTLGHMDFKDLTERHPPITYRAVTQAWKIVDNSVLYLPFGSSLAFLRGTTCYMANEKFEIIGDTGRVEKIDLVAKSFLNTPYLWGGRTHFGVDCSGFTQAIFRTRGISLLRDASMQVGQGTTVNSLAEAKLGDLAFFNNTDDKITHVGMMLNKEYIIHASGKVKIDMIDDKGIYSEQLKRYTHPLHSIKRFI